MTGQNSTDPAVVYPMDMKSMMKALKRGGAASRTPLFCCVCDALNSIRGNIKFQRGDEILEFSHLEIEKLRKLWDETQDISFFKPLKFNISKETHVLSIHLYVLLSILTHPLKPNALPGVTSENVSPCTLHGDQRSVNNELHYHLSDVSSRLLSDQTKQDFPLNFKLKGTQARTHIHNFPLVRESDFFFFFFFPN